MLTEAHSRKLFPSLVCDATNFLLVLTLLFSKLYRLIALLMFRLLAQIETNSYTT